jgi:hypothetical protein
MSICIYNETYIPTEESPLEKKYKKKWKVDIPFCECCYTVCKQVIDLLESTCKVLKRKKKWIWNDVCEAISSKLKKVEYTPEEMPLIEHLIEVFLECVKIREADKNNCYFRGNKGTVGGNKGTVGKNKGTVGKNKGTVGKNKGTVGGNKGTVGGNKVPKNHIFHRRFTLLLAIIVKKLYVDYVSCLRYYKNRYNQILTNKMKDKYYDQFIICRDIIHKYGRSRDIGFFKNIFDMKDIYGHE